MTDTEYFSQRMNPREFERCGFLPMPVSENHYHGESNGHKFDLFYDAKSGVMSIYLVSEDEEYRTPMIDRVRVFTPNEFNFLLNRAARWNPGVDLMRPPGGGGTTIVNEAGVPIMYYQPSYGHNHGFEPNPTWRGSVGFGSRLNPMDAALETIADQSEDDSRPRLVYDGISENELDTE